MGGYKDFGANNFQIAGKNVRFVTEFTTSDFLERLNGGEISANVGDIVYFLSSSAYGLLSYSNGVWSNTTIGGTGIQSSGSGGDSSPA